RPLADTPIIDVAAEIARRNGIDDVGFLWCQADDPEMGPDRDADVFQDAVVLLNNRMVDRHTRIIDGLMHHTIRIGLRHPAEVIDRTRPVLLSAAVDFVNRAHLAGLRLSEQIVVMKAPPRGSVAAK